LISAEVSIVGSKSRILPIFDVQFPKYPLMAENTGKGLPDRFARFCVQLNDATQSDAAALAEN